LKNITVTTQAELDAIHRIEVDECVAIETAMRLNAKIEVLGTLTLKASLECDGALGLVLVAPEKSSPRIEAWGSSSPRIEAMGSSSPRIEAMESSSPRIVAMGSSSPRIVAMGSSSPRIEAWGSSLPRIEAWGSSSPRIVAWGSAVLQLLTSTSLSKFVLNGFSVLILDAKLKVQITKSKNAIVQRVKDQGWLERNGVKKSKEVVLFKRVSKDFKTQAGTTNETLWTPGTTVEHEAWCPDKQECGPGKFHACSRPYFCDEFRDVSGDRYVAIRIALADLYEWKDNTEYPHKIGFRKGTVLFECDRHGEVETDSCGVHGKSER